MGRLDDTAYKSMGRKKKKQRRKVVEPAPAYEGRAREVLIPGK